MNSEMQTDEYGTKSWYLNGKLHREDGPAVEYPDGSKEWFLNGKRHRTDGPAYEGAGGTKEWWVNGKLHREDGPAYEEVSGVKEWYQNDKLHREDGPAIEDTNGSKYWYRNDQLHRTDGPAIEYPNGSKYWYLNDINYSEEEWKEMVSLVKRPTHMFIEVSKGRYVNPQHVIEIIENEDGVVETYGGPIQYQQAMFILKLSNGEKIPVVNEYAEKLKAAF